ncbi:cyanophycin synthetase [Streptomyces olivaceoviridis]|uniref:glutamate ligase domain-containing protein n=1 Tax=Streptomyces olivaceoviridis TaxID=1921 RepID=UPI0033B88D63
MDAVVTEHGGLARPDPAHSACSLHTRPDRWTSRRTTVWPSRIPALRPLSGPRPWCPARPVGEAAGVRVFDSFAHHPDEVSADLAAARSLVELGRRVIAVFQPSDLARLDAFGVDFGKALAGCDQVVLTDSMRGVPSAALELLSAHVTSAGGSVQHILRDRIDAAMRAAEMAGPGDVVVLMGSGDLVESGPALLATLGTLVAPAA